MKVDEKNSSISMDYYIGVDGGGTKTEFLMFSKEGYIVDRVVLGGCNPNSVGLEDAFNILCEGVDILSRKHKNIKGIFIGASGMATGTFSEQIKSSFKKKYPNIVIDCVTDIYNVISSCEMDDDCIAVISGTGLVINAYCKGQLKRVAGWGYLFEIAGSGFNIGKDAICAALSEKDGTGKKTIITEMVEKELCDDIHNSISKIYASDYSYVASFAQIVFDAFELGDDVAKEIIDKNAERIAYLINKLIDKYDHIKTVLVSGSLFTTNNIYLDFLLSKINRDMNFIIPTVPQVYGACVMCCKLCDIKCNNLKENFLKQYKNFV